ncbi:protein translocase subunit SecF [Kocuria sp. TGY1127_2]|uniref:protein translocase subunit SecF n=1 Tax=Kocuria sp. TGY1127_2 TaxID=2711328 RepID=UPI0015BE5BF2|nr:protein translocase subunit SecF [Kocuria sp. TGY1127_2]
MPKFAEFGSNLYTGKTSLPFIPKKKLWLGISAVLVIIALLIPVLTGGFKMGIDFRGGSEFTVSDAKDTDIQTGKDAVSKHAGAAETEVTRIAAGTVRVQTEQLSDDDTLAVKEALQKAYDVKPDDVTSSYVGPTWGAGVTRQATWGLIVFVVLATIGMALYFRTVKMSLSAIAGLLFTVITTAGVYALVGFEVTPSAIIGFLTILSYSLYDSVVVFDKIRENTKGYRSNRKRTFADEVNLAVNQTLVRSINTSVVGILPVGSILFIGAFLLGAGTLQDLSLALFIGIIMGTLGTLFVSAPLYAVLRQGEKPIKEQARLVEGVASSEDTAAASETGRETRSSGSSSASRSGSSAAGRSPQSHGDVTTDTNPVPRLDPGGDDKPDNGAVV